MKKITEWFRRFVCSPTPKNSIYTMSVYRHNSTWVFDNPSAGLIKEPFVEGADEVFDLLVEDYYKIATIEEGMYVDILFSSGEFPSWELLAQWEGKSWGGNNYSVVASKNEHLLAHELWLCPALLKYFRYAPSHIYMKVIKIGST